MASKKTETHDSSSKGEDKPVKIDKWDGSAVKNTLDDAVKRVFTEKFHLRESHCLMDGRLTICGVAVGAALFALLWDYLHPFPESKIVLIACVLSYFVLMGVLTLYTTFLEKGIHLVALQKDPAGVDPNNVWKVSSALKRFDDQYQMVMAYTPGKSGQTREAKMEKSVANYFDENGVLRFDLFEPEVSRLYHSLLQERKEK